MTGPAVEEFKIQILDNGTVRGEWIHLGQSRTSTEGSVDLDDLRRRTIDVLTDLLRRNQLTSEEELKLLGDHLFVTLLGRETRRYSEGGRGPGALLRDAVREVPESGEDEARRRLLRVRLEIRGTGNAHLASWPWEYLHIPVDPEDYKSDIFLGESAELMLTRQMPLAGGARPIQVQPPLRVLFVVLSPRSEALPDIEYGSVLAELVKLRDGDGGARIDLRVLAQHHMPDGTEIPDEDGDAERDERATYESFRMEVERWAPHVIHVISRGRYLETSAGRSCGQLAFPSGSSEPLWISDSDLANYLMSSPRLRLVFLQACETAETSSSPYPAISGVAQSLAQRNIPAVVAMHFQINSAVANKFARTFYQHLMRHTRIEVAMHEARQHIYFGSVVGENNRRDFGLPVLYLGDSSPLLGPQPQAASASRRRPSRRQSAPPLTAGATGAPRTSDLAAYQPSRPELHETTERAGGERNIA